MPGRYEAHALEMSLAENTVRLAMHPADQFQAFGELIDKGQTAAHVAMRFGVEESLVHTRGLLTARRLIFLLCTGSPIVNK